MAYMHLLAPTQAELEARDFAIEQMTGFIPQIVGAFEDDPITNSTASDLYAIQLEDAQFGHMLADIGESDVTAHIAGDAPEEGAFGAESYHALALRSLDRASRSYACKLELSTEGARFGADVKTAIREHPDKLREQYQITTEGFFTNLEFRLGKLKMGMGVIDTRFNQAVKKFEERGPLDGVIEKPAYAKWLGLESGHHTAKDVIRAVGAFLEQRDIVKARNAINEITNSYKEVGEKIKQGKLLDNQRQAGDVQRQLIKMRDLHASIRNEYSVPEDVNCTIDPLRPEDVKAIQAIFRKHYRENDIRDIEQAMKSSKDFFTSARNTELLKRASNLVMSPIQRDLIRSIKFSIVASRCAEIAYAAFSSNQHALNALAYYVKDSTD